MIPNQLIPHAEVVYCYLSSRYTSHYFLQLSRMSDYAAAQASGMSFRQESIVSDNLSTIGRHTIQLNQHRRQHANWSYGWNITLPCRLGDQETRLPNVVDALPGQARAIQPMLLQKDASLPSAQWGGCKWYHHWNSRDATMALRRTLSTQAVSVSAF